ncbi:MAG: D-cysteine desulfhydrase family protein [Sphaerobacteraceae bacterium]|nr:MAG: D-cysteine desulfhydrase family protein [Sphaerobacteraceae bacterium]
MRLTSIPRVDIAHLPTPLEPAPNLSAELGGPEIWIKRDDLTGLALGGNKARKLEYLVADALAQDATVLMTAGAPQSNHCRQTAAAARKSGLKAVLIFAPYSKHYGSTDPDQAPQGNLLLDNIMGAKIEWYQGDWQDRLRFMDQVAADLRDKGERPYVIPGGGSNAIGATAYVNAVYETITQLRDNSMTATHWYTTSSTSGGTHAGLALGAKLAHAPFAVVGSACDQNAEKTRSVVLPLANATAEHIGSDVRLVESDIVIDDNYYLPSYGIPNEGCLEAIEIAARTEGLLLDPVYTGKTMSALIDHIRTGKLTSSDVVIFHHTGGTPALFAQADGIAGSFSGPDLD